MSWDGAWSDEEGVVVTAEGTGCDAEGLPLIYGVMEAGRNRASFFGEYESEAGEWT
jgi:hypothetical protein